MSFNLSFLGIILLFIAIALIILGSHGKGETKWVIGIFPFFIGNDSNLIKFMFIFSFVLIVILLIKQFLI